LIVVEVGASSSNIDVHLRHSNPPSVVKFVDSIEISPPRIKHDYYHASQRQQPSGDVVEPHLRPIEAAANVRVDAISIQVTKHVLLLKPTIPITLQ
jgi:hypothetical protein